MSVTTLKSLPPSLFDELSKWLRVPQVFKLTVLSGDKTIFNKAIKHGGVTELVGQAGGEINWRRVFGPGLFSIASLTKIDVGYQSGVLFTDHLPPWMDLLPPTLLDIRIQSSNLLLRAVDDENDDDFTRFVCSTQGFTVIRLDERFPRLHTLEVRDNAIEWKDFMFARLIQHLPRSLTSFRLPVAKEINDMDSGVPFPLNILSNLTTFEWIANTAAPTLGSLLLPHLSEQKLSEMDFSSPSSDILAHLSNLKHLTLKSIDADASVSLLSRLSNVTYLSIQFTNKWLANSPLPPNLRTLKVHFVLPVDSTFHFSAYPDLTHLYMDFRGSSARVAIDSLPSQLKHLELETTMPLTIQLCSVPVSLTSLELNAPITAASDFTLTHVTDLRMVSIPYLKPDRLPSTLSGLSMSHPLDMAELMGLPKSLKSLYVSVRLTAAEWPVFEPLKVWNQESITGVFQTWFPELSTSVSDITTYCDRDFMMALRLQPDLTEYHCEHYDQWIPIDGWVMPPTLTRCITRIYASKASISSIPPGMVDLDVPRHYTVPASNDVPHLGSLFDDPSAEPPQHEGLPKTLQSLSVLQPSSFKEDEKSFLFPLSPRLISPLLSKLSLIDLGTLLAPYLMLLPNTLTDLEVHFVGPVCIPEISPNWLPNLKRLSLNRCAIPIHNTTHRLLQHHDILEVLDLSWLVLHGDLFLPYSDNRIDALSLRAHCLRHLFPRHLRSKIQSVIVEWTQEALSRLPSTLTEAVFSHPIIDQKLLGPTSTQRDFARFLPPSLTNLTLSRYLLYQHFEDTRCYPSALKRLQVLDAFFDLPHFQGLPRGLTSLTFECTLTSKATIRMFSRDMAKALPALKQLRLRIAKFESGVFECLPSSLIRLDCSVPGLPSTENPITALPKSLMCLILSRTPSATIKSMLHNIQEHLPALVMLYSNYNVNMLHVSHKLLEAQVPNKEE